LTEYADTILLRKAVSPGDMRLIRASLPPALTEPRATFPLLGLNS